jgi:hypothetical protein
MDFFKLYNIVQIASVNVDILSNGPQMQQIILKPSQSAKKKISHFKLLKKINQKKNNQIIEQYIDNPFDNIISYKSTIDVKWNYRVQKIGEYEYYYLDAIVKSGINPQSNYSATPPDYSATLPDYSTIYLTIVKKNDLSIYVFLKYPNTCYYMVSIILDKYLKNYWKIENF